MCGGPGAAVVVVGAGFGELDQALCVAINGQSTFSEAATAQSKFSSCQPRPWLVGVSRGLRLDSPNLGLRHESVRRVLREVQSGPDGFARTTRAPICDCATSKRTNREYLFMSSPLEG